MHDVLDLKKSKNPKTGKVHLSFSGLSPICREMPSKTIFSFVETEDDKCNCKDCLRELERLLFTHLLDKQMSEYYDDIFVQFDENEHSCLANRPGCPEGLLLDPPIGVSIYGMIPI